MSPLRFQVDPANVVDPEPNADTCALSTSRGQTPTPAARPGLLARCRRSVWVPVAAKASGIALLMLGLAGIGTASILNTAGGVPLSVAALSTEVSGNWLPTAAASPSGNAWVARKPAPGAPASHGSDTNLAASSPSPGEASLSEASQSETGEEPDAGLGESRAPGLTPDGKVILNTATAKELTRLPGVGAKRAVSILKLRERLKRFRRATDLLRVRGIGVRSLRRMLPHLVLDPPDPPPKEDPG